MSDLVCPRCSEAEDLDGQRDGDVITITCLKCHTEWDRDLNPKCDKCGNTDVRIAFQAIVEKSRGTQLSMNSLRRLYLCPDCDEELLAYYNLSNRPLPPDELPTESQD